MNRSISINPKLNFLSLLWFIYPLLTWNQEVATQLFFSTAIHHTCGGRSTCALRVRGDVKAEAKSAASLRHLEGEETLEQVHAGLRARQHLIRSSYTLQQPESHAQQAQTKTAESQARN